MGRVMGLDMEEGMKNHHENNIKLLVSNWNKV